jgi:hypothetical protein
VVEQPDRKQIHAQHYGFLTFHVRTGEPAANEDLRHNPVRNSDRAGIMEEFATPAGWLADRCIDCRTLLGLWIAPPAAAAPHCKDGRLNQGATDLYSVPYNAGNGGDAKPVPGASDKNWEEFYAA